jgi:PIN domain nuclease of toxin-antitoxin system
VRLLLDTHILLWWLSNDQALSAGAREVISDSKSEVFVSAATVWEIAIKHSLGKLIFPVGEIINILNESDFLSLGIEIEHVLLAGMLPQHHADPFDRMLIAQAQHEGLTIVSVDSQIRKYAVSVF